MRKTPAMTAFLEKYYQNGRPSERLAKRQGLRGGRVESFQMCFNQSLHADRELSYTDVNSLYPHSALTNGM